MFSSRHRSTCVSRLSSALLLVRSFLLLEDDYDVDWEVDPDEPTEPFGTPAQRPVPDLLDVRLPDPRRAGLRGRDCGAHPHRVALRSRLGERRPGEAVPDDLVCLCPVPARAQSERHLKHVPRAGAI